MKGTRAMKFSYNAVWDYTLALLRAHWPLIAAIAGVFIFLPSLMVGHFLPPPQGGSSNPQADIDLVTAYWSTTWYWQLLAVLATMVGTLAIIILVADRTRPTVGAAIASAFRLIPFYLLATFLVAAALVLAATVGLVPFALLAAVGLRPILYLGMLGVAVLMFYAGGRLAVLGQVVALEGRMPLTAIRRTIELTRGHGWAIFFLLFLILLAGEIAVLAAGFVVGALFRLLLAEPVADLLILIVSSALGSALTAVIVLASTAVYQALAGSESPASLFE
jgi:hypothetical protein